MRASAASACDRTRAGDKELPCTGSTGQAGLEGAPRAAARMGSALPATGAGQPALPAPTACTARSLRGHGRHPEYAGVGGGDAAEEHEEVLPAVQAAAALGHQQAGRQRAAQDLAPAAAGSAAARPGTPRAAPLLGAGLAVPRGHTSLPDLVCVTYLAGLSVAVAWG